MRFASAFQSEENQDKRQQQLEQWGVKVTRSLEEAVGDADVIMMEVNDPALHLKYFKQLAGLNKPIFLDKPLAGSLEDGQAICELVQKKQVKVWSSSALRFASELAGACAETPEPILCNVYGPLGAAPAGSSIVWYGVHAFEMLNTIMGQGARSVLARRDARGAVAIVAYKDNRRGIVECNDGLWSYGGRVQSGKKCTSFLVQSALYVPLVRQIRDFFQGGKAPVALAHTLEIQALLDATERSLASGAEEAVRL
jgi:predicted dehydrogenase